MKIYVSSFEEFKKSVKSYVKRNFDFYASVDCGEKTIICINKTNNKIIFVIVNDGKKVVLNYKKLWDDKKEAQEDISDKHFEMMIPTIKKIVMYATTPFLKEKSKVYVLAKNSKQCPFCDKKIELAETYTMMVTNLNGLTFNRTLLCPKCRKTFIKYGWLKINKKQAPNYNYEQVNTEKEVIQEESADFLVRVSSIKCRTNGHKIKNVKATVNVSINGVITEKSISGYYCENCKKYYILESDYQKLRSKGIILCKIVEQKLINRQSSYGYLLNSESILHSYGYNVNAQENLSSSERRTILKFILNNHILSKSDIKSHLDYLIKRSNNNTKLQDAIYKWQSDRLFIDDYNVSSEPTLKIKSLKIKVYIQQ